MAAAAGREGLAGAGAGAAAAGAATVGAGAATTGDEAALELPGVDEAPDDAAAAVKSGKSGSKQHDLPTGEKHNEIRVSTLSSLCINISSDCYRYFSFLSLFFQSIIAAHI